MSTWRDIWRYGVIANRLFAESEERGEKAFDKLMEVYDRPEKDGKSRQDGMIRYIKAEAYERKYWETNKEEYREKALKNYKSAENLFPVPHWKKVAKDSIKRINKTTITYDSDFERMLWQCFHEAFGLVYLNDFARYVCLSALARGSSEWPLSLVDFRTVLELEIKQCFPEIIEEFNDENRYSLRVAIDRLHETGKISFENKEAFHDIRKAGNIAAHTLYSNPKFKFPNLNNFVKVLNFFNEYRQHNPNKKSKNMIPYPLCQITLEEFNLIPDEDRLSKIQKY